MAGLDVHLRMDEVIFEEFTPIDIQKNGNRKEEWLADRAGNAGTSATKGLNGQRHPRPWYRAVRPDDGCTP